MTDKRRFVLGIGETKEIALDGTESKMQLEYLVSGLNNMGRRLKSTFGEEGSSRTILHYNGTLVYREMAFGNNKLGHHKFVIVDADFLKAIVDYQGTTSELR